MRGTGDARVMVANALLAPGLQHLLVEIEPGRCDLSQILFDDTLVLCGWRDERSLEDRALAIETVAVIENAPGASVQA
jgi:hypothetical protein